MNWDLVAHAPRYRTGVNGKIWRRAIFYRPDCGYYQITYGHPYGGESQDLSLLRYPRQQEPPEIDWRHDDSWPVLVPVVSMRDDRYAVEVSTPPVDARAWARLIADPDAFFMEALL